MNHSDATQMHDPLTEPLEEAPRTIEYLQWLQEEVDRIKFNDPERCFALVEHGLLLAEEMASREYIASFLVTRAFHWNNQWNFDAARADLAEVDRHAAYLPDTTARWLRMRMWYALSLTMSFEGDFIGARRCLLDALVVAQEREDVSWQTAIHGRLSDLYSSLGGDMQSAVSHITSALRLCPRGSDQYGPMVFSLAHLAYLADDFVTARAYMDEALLVDDPTLLPYQAIRCTLSSLIYKEEGKLDEALVWADRAVDAARAQQSYPLALSQALGSRAKIRFMQNKLWAAIEDLEESLQPGIAGGEFCQTLCNLALCYAAIASGKVNPNDDRLESLTRITMIAPARPNPWYDEETISDAERKARELLARAEDMLEGTPPSFRGICLGIISDTKMFLDDYAGAYIALIQMRELEKELYSTTVKNEIGSIRLLIKLEREEHEREIQRMKAQQVEQELGNTTLQLLAQTELLRDLRNDLLKIARKIPPTEAAAKELRNRIKNLPCESVDWEKFDRQFKAVHPDFIRTLTERAPDLTATEVRICTMLRMNLKSHEMAQIFCISEAGVEFHRGNIRRKLGLKREEKLPIVLGAM